MIINILHIFGRKTMSLGKDDSGAALLITLGVFLFLFIMVSGVYAVGSTIQQRIELQNAADAAAYSAAVVQADGLSRMATVNRAMSWTYVQMTKRQMDYITYRWLKLTMKRFNEDRKNAEDFYFYCPFTSVGQYPIPASPEWIRLKNGHCEHGRWKNPGLDNFTRKNGLGWFCGLGYDKPDVVSLNGSDRGVNIEALASAVNKYEEEFLNPLAAQLNGGAGDSDVTGNAGDSDVTGNAGDSDVTGNIGGSEDDDKGPIVRDANGNTFLPETSQILENTMMEYFYKQAKNNLLEAIGAEPQPDDLPDTTGYEAALGNYNRKKFFFSESEFPEGPDEEDFEGRLPEYQEAMAVYRTGMNALKQYCADKWYYDGNISALQTRFEAETGLLKPVCPSIPNTQDETQADREAYYNYIQRSDQYCEAFKTWLNNQEDAKLKGWLHNPSTATQNLTSNSQAVRTSTSAFENSGNGNVSNDNLTNAVSRAASGNSATWGAPLAQLIEMDKTNIEFMNQSLSVINDNMRESMRDTALIVLTLNLTHNNADSTNSDEFLKGYQYYYKPPIATNPYELTTENTTSYFSAMHNTEPHERLFLEMGNTNMPPQQPHRTLKSYFISEIEAKPQDDGGLASNGRGIDQWFIRGAAQYDESGKLLETARMAQDSTGDIQGEGGLGIMRVYKSANCNETHSGFLGGITGQVNRGNHVIHIDSGALFTLPDISISFELGGVDVGKQISDSLFAPIKTAISDMLGGLTQLADIAPSCGNKKSLIPYMCREVDDTIALYSEYRWSSAKWFCYWKRKKLQWKAKWRSHVGLPKTACGAPNYIGLKFVPPYGLACGNTNHGYMENTLDFEGFLKPLENTIGGGNISRNNYQSCAMMIDNPKPPYLQGHARIYGDDKEIFDEHYAGISARPWILNEKFFSGDGTIIVGVSRKQTNPFSQILGSFDGFCPGIFSIFDPPGKNENEERALWALSSARAGVRNVRQGAAERVYTIYFDDTHRKLRKHKDIRSNEDFGARESNDFSTQIQGGCVCDDMEAGKITGNWNLCEVDWDAVLLPLRYAEQKTLNAGDERIWDCRSPFPVETTGSYIYGGAWKDFYNSIFNLYMPSRPRFGSEQNTDEGTSRTLEPVTFFKQNKIH